MNRRELLRLLGSAGIAGALPLARPAPAAAEVTFPYTDRGAGPALFVLKSTYPRQARFYDGFLENYRVVEMFYPAPNVLASADAFTADRVCADILELADRLEIDRFAWYGYSWGAVVGLQLASRTDRLTALVEGGWPPLGAPYKEMVTIAEAGPKHILAFYKSIRDWPEWEAVSKITCPRMVFAGRNDEFVAAGFPFRIGQAVSDARGELESLGWVVRMVDDVGHELGGRPDVVVPLVREFLAPYLQRG